jgi:hypothetical protein
MSAEIEARRLAIQTVAELDRGLELIDRQLRAGQFMAARETAQTCRALVQAQDGLFQEYFKEAKS